MLMLSTEPKSVKIPDFDAPRSVTLYKTGLCVQMNASIVFGVCRVTENDAKENYKVYET